MFLYSRCIRLLFRTGDSIRVLEFRTGRVSSVINDNVFTFTVKVVSSYFIYVAINVITFPYDKITVAGVGLLIVFHV